MAELHAGIESRVPYRSEGKRTRLTPEIGPDRAKEPRMINRAWRWIAVALLLLLGLARGAGGVLVLAAGSAVAGPGSRTDAPSWLIGGSLILVGMLCLVGSVLLVQRSPSGFWVALAALVAFVLGGILNGVLLYGSPRPMGVLGNTAYAVVTFVVLWLGTQGVRRIKAGGGPCTNA